MATSPTSSGKTPPARPALAAALALPLLLTLAFWILAAGLWAGTGKVFYLFNFGYIGTALGVGLGVYALLPRRQKPRGRRLAQVLIGVYLLGFVGLVQQENLQMEGFFAYLWAGFFAGSVIHYLVAKVAGPLLFHRGWCGWACWTAMVLDLLPFRTVEPGRGAPKSLGWLRWAHAVLSFALVAVLWWIFGWRTGGQGPSELVWLLAGNALYYGAGIALAFRFRDNRAFCKVLCPVPVFQKPAARFSLLKIGAPAQGCTACGLCSKACPMGVDVAGDLAAGRRVRSTECILCLTCASACPRGLPRMAFPRPRPAS